MPRRSIRIVLQMVCVHRSTGRGCAVVVSVEVVRIHHGGMVLVPKRVCWVHVSGVVRAVLLGTATKSQVLNSHESPSNCAQPNDQHDVMRRQQWFAREGKLTTSKTVVRHGACASDLGSAK